MSSELLSWVYDRIEASDLDDETGLLIVAAIEGDAALAGLLDDGTSPARPERPAGAADAPAPGGAFLSSVTVEGFRGIGPSTTLTLRPAPGLTVVAGRNGSGKSSLSEALELVLTGSTYRWSQRSSQWRERWRNLHHPTARVSVEVIEEDRGPVTVTTTWADGVASVDERTTTTQRTVQGARQPATVGTADLAWDSALEQFRPILSYDELGGMMESKPSELHDAIARVLGVEQISDGLKRLQVELRMRKRPGTDLGTRRSALVTELRGVDDQRAVAAAALLGKRSPDVAAVTAVVTGTAVVDRGPLAALRSLASLAAPADRDAAGAAARALRAAVGGVAAAGAAASARLLARLDLLERALEMHQVHGDMECPVCRRGTLDRAWSERHRAQAATDRETFVGIDLARQDLDSAVVRARRLLVARPAVLDTTPVPALAEAVADARQAWDAWCDAPLVGDAADATALADHLEDRVEWLELTMDALRVAASAEVAALDDQWAPLATRVGAWCTEWSSWLYDKPGVDRLVAAEKWLKANDLALKNERLRPIQEGARDAWAKLRQESDVDLSDLTLTGTGTQRRVRIDATVDGADADSIAVLSQGELHALALSIFLPRATMAESPFRFLVLDDPVQAMDPAKVDGLVDLLGELARDRQVVVLSHDDRLPAAVRRSELSATILEVERGSRSTVSVATSTDPARRYLKDAFGLVKEHEVGRLDEAAMRRTLPGLVRFAVEAAARDRHYAAALAGGGRLEDAERAWADADSTRKRVGLAWFGHEPADHEMQTLTSRPFVRETLATTGLGFHAGLPSHVDAKQTARSAERLVELLQGP